MTKGQINIIRPQPGYQTLALSSPADIVIGGGAAGVGKTFTLLLDPLKHLTKTPGFETVIFRRTYAQIQMAGGLWDASSKLYREIRGAEPRQTALEWVFPVGKGKSRVKFAHLQHEKDKYNYQGSEIALLGFDELTHFTESMFFYLLTRNRSTCGVRPYVRATCNPDPDSWVADLIAWWIGEDGYPIPERQGKVRHFFRSGGKYVWGDSVEEVHNAARWEIDELVNNSADLIQVQDLIKSLTFIGGSIYDNKKLLEIDPGYIGNLNAQDELTKSQLLYGNWKVRIDGSELFNYENFTALFVRPSDLTDQTGYITADIALMGSDKFIVGYWVGKTLTRVLVVPKSDGKQVYQTIADLAKTYGVKPGNIAFDADGVGGFLGGFLPGAQAFHGGAKAMEAKDGTNNRKIKENYVNLRAQVYYRAAAAVNRGEYSVSEEVAAQMYDDRQTVRQRMIYERRAIKRRKPDGDGKLSIIPKDEMKPILSGTSPDMLDMFVMREYFDLKPKRGWAVAK